MDERREGKGENAVAIKMCASDSCFPVKTPNGYQPAPPIRTPTGENIGSCNTPCLSPATGYYGSPPLSFPYALKDKKARPRFRLINIVMDRGYMVYATNPKVPFCSLTRLSLLRAPETHRFNVIVISCHSMFFSRVGPSSQLPNRGFSS